MKHEFLKRSVVGLTALSLVLAGMPVQAASINIFKLGRDVVTLDGNRATGEYIGLQYAAADTAGISSVVLEIANAATVGDVSGAVSTTLNLDNPALNVNEINSTVKIDPDSNAAFVANSIKRLTIIVTSPAGVKRSAPTWLTIFSDLKVANFDADGKTAPGGTDISPIILKQNGATSSQPTPGNMLLVTKSFTNPHLGSSTLMLGNKQIELALGATAGVDADIMPVGKYSVRLKAFTKIDKKLKEILSANTVAVSVLAQPKLTKQSFDTAGTQDGNKSKELFTTSLTGDDKMVIKWDAVNLSKLKIDVYQGATPVVSKELVGGNANGINKTIALDADNLTKGLTYTVKLTGYNTDDYLTGVWTSAATLPIN